MKKIIIKQVMILTACLLAFSAGAEIMVEDDAGNRLSFSQPVTRIVSLAPHATELLFAAGATNQVVGTVNYSDYPEAAKKIPVIGGYNKIDLESIIAMKPELVMIWPGGNSSDQLDAVKKLGLKVFVSEPVEFEDVVSSIRNMAMLLGTQQQAEKNATDYLQQLAELKKTYRNRSPVNVFYQVWNEPLMTINKGHLVSRIIELCGGVNVFADLPVLAPRVSIEAVMEKDPEVIIAGMTEDRAIWLEQWQRWTGLQAVKNKHVYPIDAELVIRQTPRVIQGTRKMCEYLDRVRELK